MPASPHPLVLRGREALQRGDMRAVEAAADERLKTAGRDVNALELRFIVQHKRGQYGQAARTLDTVIGIDPRADWAYNELVQLFLSHGKHEEAEGVARAALRANPRNAQAHHLFGTILTDTGRIPPGEWHLRAALELGFKPPAVPTSTPAAAAAADNGEQKVSHPEYRADTVDTLFDECKRFFTRENSALLARAKQRPNTPQPIFLMGFPCSGAELVEQILSGHSAIAAGRQLPFLGDLSRLASQIYPGPERFPANLANSWLADYRYTAAVFRDDYLARAEQYGLLAGARRYFTDTMPFNEIYLPLVNMAFPDAKIVHVVRDPLAIHASTSSHKVSNKLHCHKVEDITHYLGAVSDLVRHYRGVLELRDLEIRYETLMSEQAATTHRLLEYLELPVEDACLNTKLAGY